jgi:ABC-2 type transport system ATP-binding protein
MITGGDHAVILSTHIVETVAASCTCAVLLADGQITRSWDARELDAARKAPGGFEEAVMAALERQ